MIETIQKNHLEFMALQHKYMCDLSKFHGPQVNEKEKTDHAPDLHKISLLALNKSWELNRFFVNTERIFLEHRVLRRNETGDLVLDDRVRFGSLAKIKEATWKCRHVYQLTDRLISTSDISYSPLQEKLLREFCSTQVVKSVLRRQIENLAFHGSKNCESFIREIEELHFHFSAAHKNNVIAFRQLKLDVRLIERINASYSLDLSYQEWPDEVELVDCGD